MGNSGIGVPLPELAGTPAERQRQREPCLGAVLAKGEES